MNIKEITTEAVFEAVLQDEENYSDNIADKEENTQKKSITFPVDRELHH